MNEQQQRRQPARIRNRKSHRTNLLLPGKIICLRALSNGNGVRRGSQFGNGFKPVLGCPAHVHCPGGLQPAFSPKEINEGANDRRNRQTADPPLRQMPPFSHAGQGRMQMPDNGQGSCQAGRNGGQWPRIPVPPVLLVQQHDHGFRVRVHAKLQSGWRGRVRRESSSPRRPGPTTTGAGGFRQPRCS